MSMRTLYANMSSLGKFGRYREIIRNRIKGQTLQWPKEKGQSMDYKKLHGKLKTERWATRTTLKTGSEHRCSGRVCSSCCTSDTHLVTLVTNTR